MARKMGIDGPLPIGGRSFTRLGTEWLLDCFDAVMMESEAMEDAQEEAALGYPSHMGYAD